jgi:transcriptional regulator with XRE-family HTH domain
MNRTVLQEIAEKLNVRFPVATWTRELGFSKSVVSKYYNSEKRPSENFIKKIESLYNINYNDFEKSSKKVLETTETKSIDEIMDAKIEKALKPIKDDIQTLKDAQFKLYTTNLDRLSEKLDKITGNDNKESGQG